MQTQSQERNFPRIDQQSWYASFEDVLGRKSAKELPIETHYSRQTANLQAPKQTHLHHVLLSDVTLSSSANQNLSLS
jgi:hypothetical protein